jgi:integrase
MTAPHNALKKIDKHKHYYVSPASGKITYRRMHMGVPIVIRTGKTKISEAKEFVEVELERLRTGKPERAIRRERSGVSNPLVEDIWNELLEKQDEGKEATTRKNYRKSWEYGFGGFFGKLTAHQINDDTMTAYRSWYLKNNPKRFFRNTYVHLKMLLRYMHSQGYISRIPDMRVLGDIDEVVAKRSQKKQVGRVYSDKEVAALLSVHEKLAVRRLYGIATAKRMQTSIRAKLGIRLGLSGLRMMEGVGLKWSQVDEREKVLKVWSKKNHKWRDVPMSDDLIAVFREQRAVNSASEWVFPMPTDPGRHITGAIFQKIWINARKAAGIASRYRGEARFHDLRHTFATWTAEQGWPPRVACDVLDMSLKTYEQVYAKPRLQSKAEWMEKTSAKQEELV